VASPPAAVPDLGVLGQDPVHRGDRAQVHPTIEQGGVHLQRRAVDELVAAQHGQHPRPLNLGQRVRRRYRRRRKLGERPGRRSRLRRRRGGRTRRSSRAGTRRVRRGAPYGVDVTKPDGTRLDVRLDRNFAVLGSQPAVQDAGGDGGDGDGG